MQLMNTIFSHLEIGESSSQVMTTNQNGFQEQRQFMIASMSSPSASKSEVNPDSTVLEPFLTAPRSGVSPDSPQEQVSRSPDSPQERGQS